MSKDGVVWFSSPITMWPYDTVTAVTNYIHIPPDVDPMTIILVTRQKGHSLRPFPRPMLAFTFIDKLIQSYSRRCALWLTRWKVKLQKDCGGVMWHGVGRGQTWTFNCQLRLVYSIGFFISEYLSKYKCKSFSLISNSDKQPAWSLLVPLLVSLLNALCPAEQRL